jgi:hypothetical protein
MGVFRFTLQDKCFFLITIGKLVKEGSQTGYLLGYNMIAFQLKALRANILSGSRILMQGTVW